MPTASDDVVVLVRRSVLWSKEVVPDTAVVGLKLVMVVVAEEVLVVVQVVVDVDVALNCVNERHRQPSDRRDPT